ncbi:MAG: arylsulfotransferase family protein [Desulfarculaceae bacterium]|nr:arylsulfotransferase family protein [Desulfarculaceae bacterium]MCF8074295.1 arylsulfotransferase family protein [Desulfarculaceae bacterium]MCF8103363.1 arylsulfotransferase family protein [Desulfarculaceae bacterium]MCF8117847.1 arylsulfotransferase family protein [Desulfarculaceae bacterium]
MNFPRSRLPLALLGALIGLVVQLVWLGNHGWDQAGTRILAGLAGGALALWLLGEGIAWLARRMGRDFWGWWAARVWPCLGRASLWRGTALAWLALLAGFVAGLYVYASHNWPYPLVSSIEAWFTGEGGASLNQKLANDLDITPARHLVTTKYRPPSDRAYRNLTGLPLRGRRLPPKIFLAPEAPPSLRVVFGAFDFKDRRYAAVLLGPEGKVRHIWEVSQEDVAWEHRPDTNVFPHGFAVDRQGSIYVGFDNGSCLTKYGWCGNIIWRLQGHFHHSITLGDDGTLWVWGPTPGQPGSHKCLLQISQASGEVVKAIPMSKLVAANPELDIFGVRQMDREDHSEWVEDGGGPWHPNDAEPLPRSLAAAFPQFKPGDLLLSMRSLNLVLVVDPATLKVKWWRGGMVRRQHDPDWSPDGTITIYNNNMHRDWSSIVAVDPKTYESRARLDGKQYGFYSHIQGKHQVLPGGGLLITSSQQGRVFEVSPEGEVVFELLNVYDDKGRLLNLSEAVGLPLDYFEELPKCP